MAWLFWIIALGVIFWYVDTYVPMSPPIKGLVRVILILVILYWVFVAFASYAPPFPTRRL